MHLIRIADARQCKSMRKMSEGGRMKEVGEVEEVEEAEVLQRGRRLALI